MNGRRSILYELGKYKDAVRNLEKALQAAQRHQVEKWVTKLLHNLCNAYDGLGESRKAIGFHEKSLAMNLKLYPNCIHPDIAKSYKILFLA